MAEIERLDLLAARIGDELQEQRSALATVESCTGGWIAQILTDIPGSSRWFERGFITYSNEAKMDMVGVREGTLAQFGAVSEQTVREMALGGLEYSWADCALAVTGIAGPSGGTPLKPVGTVWVAWAEEGGVDTHCFNFEGDRRQVREQTVAVVLLGLLERLEARRSDGQQE